MKGIILAGGSGTRLYPSTISVSKQLIPVYDKPMIYYPLTVLMLAGINDILIITTPEDQQAFKSLLKDGSQFGIKISYEIQPKPEGLAQAFIIGEDFIGGEPVTMILGDNIFWGSEIISCLKEIATTEPYGATVFGYQVNDPERYGVVEFDPDFPELSRVLSVEEKPKNPKSNYAITGLYCYDENSSKYARQVVPSHRGELEITSLNDIYLQKGKLNAVPLRRGNAWLDTGTHESMMEASIFIETLQKRQGLLIGSPEEVALRMGYIDADQLRTLAEPMKNNSYGKYLLSLV
jgi:glucose-1-phosphate thymidylyltransferase